MTGKIKYIQVASEWLCKCIHVLFCHSYRSTVLWNQFLQPDECCSNSSPLRVWHFSWYSKKGFSHRRKMIPFQIAFFALASGSTSYIWSFSIYSVKEGKMVPLLFAFLALPCLGQGASKGLIKEEDKFHLLTQV